MGPRCIHHALLGLVGVAGVVGSLPLPTPPSMAARLRSECAPLPMFITRGQVATCYRPTDVALAERRLSPRPVGPLAAVAGVLPVRLSQVVVLTALGSGHPFSIAYVFGRPPTKPCSLGAQCPRPPDFVIVQETVGHTTAAGAGVHLAYGAFMGYGVSVATANLPRRGLFVTVTSNAGPSPQQQVLRIARRVVQAAR
jgi:hypothetical protein